MTTARDLLGEIDRLAHHPRERRIADRARAAAADGTLNTLLNDLHESTVERGFARVVGLQLAIIAHHTVHVERCLDATELPVVQRALVAAVRLRMPHAVIGDRLPRLPTGLRRAVYTVVGRCGTSDVADALLLQVRDRFGDDEAAALLPTCSAATVTEWLPRLGYTGRGWGTLGRRHPGLLLDHLEEQLEAEPKAGWQAVWDRLGAGVTAASLSEPDRVLDLLERCLPYAVAPAALTRTIGMLARHDPERMLRLLTDPRAPQRIAGGQALWRALLTADDEGLIRLGRLLLPTESRWLRFLRVVPPSRRPAIYAGVIGVHQPNPGRLPLTSLDLLPATARAQEAERLLGFRSVTDDPHLRLEASARLPWDRSRPVLREAIRRPTAEERALAYRLLISAAAGTRDGDVVADMLTDLDRLKNEQDPVREAAMSALAAVPAWLYPSRTGDRLLELITDAFQARDTSYRTQWALGNLCNRLIRHGATADVPELLSAGLSGLGVMGNYAPSIDLWGLNRQLPTGAEHRVFEALRPRLDADAARGRYHLTIALARGLGRRAWTMGPLQELIGKGCRAKDDGTVRDAIDLWLEPPATRDVRVARVLRADRSTITIWAVERAVGLGRTDLVDGVLTKSVHGRFLRRRDRYIPSFGPDCVRRWMPRQVHKLADLLVELAHDRSASTWERIRAVRHLGGLPGAADRLESFLSDPEPSIVEAALAGSAWADRPADGITVLLSHADGDHARVAVYAAARCARFLPPDELPDVLAPILRASKVTSKKEAARLLVEHRADDAVGLLTAAWAVDDQHRDVRRAIVSALTRRLDDERAWDVLAAAADAAHEVRVALLDPAPESIAEGHRPGYARLVRRVAESSEPDTARLGLDTYLRWLRWDTDGGTGLLVQRVVDLDATATWRIAIDTLVAACVTAEEPGPLCAAAEQLLGVEGPEDPDRDLPARQRLALLAHRVREAAERSSGTALRCAADLANVLAGDPTQRRLTLELAGAAAIPTGDLDDLQRLRRLARLAGPDGPASSPWPRLAWQQVDEGLRFRVEKLRPDHLLSLARSLLDDDQTGDDEQAGDEGRGGSDTCALLAAAIAGRFGQDVGWTDEWRELVLRLRAHPDDLVRSTALDTFTRHE